MSNGSAERVIQRSRSVGSLVALLVLIGCIHTGANLHGGNPTIFGIPPQAEPLWGWLIGLSAVILVPLVFNLVSLLALMVLGTGSMITQGRSQDTYGKGDGSFLK